MKSPMGLSPREIAGEIGQHRHHVLKQGHDTALAHEQRDAGLGQVRVVAESGQLFAQRENAQGGEIVGDFGVPAGQFPAPASQ